MFHGNFLVSLSNDGRGILVHFLRRRVGGEGLAGNDVSLVPSQKYERSNGTVVRTEENDRETTRKAMHPPRFSCAPNPAPPGSSSVVAMDPEGGHNRDLSEG